MKRTNVILIISILLILVSITLLGFGKKNVLGFVIAEPQASQINYFVAAVLLIVGLILFLSNKPKLEEIVKKTEVQFYISNKAIERAMSDKYIKYNLKRYEKLIDTLKNHLLGGHTYQTERMGEFNVSPQGHKKDRIAWHVRSEKSGDKEIRKVYIDDLLYHINDKDYVDKWNRKAANYEIKVNNYETAGYKQGTSVP